MHSMHYSLSPCLFQTQASLYIYCFAINEFELTSKSQTDLQIATAWSEQGSQFHDCNKRAEKPPRPQY